MSSASTARLVDARAEAAQALEHAIASLGKAYAEYRRSTAALEFRADVELERYVHTAIVLHLANAGFGVFLEQKLVGTPPALRALVDQQHQRWSGLGTRGEERY